MPGLEFSGVVAATGPDVRDLQPGARVFGILGGGGHATHVLTRESHCAEVPESLDLVDAGAVPEVFVTAHDALLVQAGLRPGERVLIHAVGSGVGTAAVQLARAVGAITVGTSRTQDKLRRAAELGLDQGVVAGGDMSAVGDVDVVLDLVGGDYVAADIAACRERGRIIVVSLLAGSACEIDLAVVMRKRLTIMGTVLRARPPHEKAVAMRRFAREVVPLFERGALRPVIERVFPLSEAPEAYDLVGSNRTFGKIVLAPGR